MSKNTPSVRVSTIILTPQRAEELLGRESRNRNISKANLATITRAIENGEWTLNGEAIKIGQSGTVLDGQHRLLAVQKSGRSIETLLIEGVPDSAQPTMDTGKRRSLGDILSIRGESNTVSLAALISRHVINLNFGMESVFQSTTGGRSLTNHECLAWYDAGNHWVREYVGPGRSASRTTPLGSAAAGFLCKTFDDIDAEDSAFFWARLADGVELAADSPIWALRDVSQKLREDFRGSRNQRYGAALTIKAWNAYREGRPVRQLKFRIGGATPETFPFPK